MKNPYRKKSSDEQAGDLFKKKGLSELVSLVGIFPDGIDDSVLDFSKVRHEKSGKGEVYMFDLQQPEITLSCINWNCVEKSKEIHA